jgi:hypothetical protein
VRGFRRANVLTALPNPKRRPPTAKRQTPNAKRQTPNALTLPPVDAEFSGTNKQEDDQNAEHFDWPGISSEVMRVETKSRQECDKHCEQNQRCCRPEEESKNQHNSTNKLGQGSKKTPNIRHETDPEISHGVPDVHPGRLTAREFLPPENDEYCADAEATDQETEIGVFGQRLKHDIRLAHELPTRQREQIVFMGWN